jgi:flagellin
MRINTNVSSLTAQEAAQNTSKTLTGSLEKLSTGLRINKASDDASGLAIADKLRTQATSINQGIANGNSAVTLLQIADKSMAEQSNILDTVKAKLIQANTATTSTAGRNAIAADISKLMTQFDNIAKTTNYNGTDLISASATALNFQVGEDTTDAIITLDAVNSSASSYGLNSLIGISSITTASASSLQTTIDTAINTLNTNRGSIGFYSKPS